MSHYCVKHGINHPAFECPRCAAEERHEEILERSREAERESERRHAEAQELEDERQREADDRHEEALHKQANPGDYQCPGCGFDTLKRGFPRCTRCTIEVGPEFWPRIYAREAAEAEQRRQEQARVAAEWARGAPERERQAKASAEAREAAERQRTEAERQRAAAADRKSRFGNLGAAVVVCAAVALGLYALAAGERSKRGGAAPSSAPTVAVPSRIPEPYRGALTEWLTGATDYRVAEVADCQCENDLDAIRAAYDNDDPYFVIADLSGDGVNDAAIALFDRTMGPSAVNPRSANDVNDLWNMAVIVFNGPIVGGTKPAAIFKKVGAPPESLLLYSKRRGGLWIASWGGDSAGISYKNGKYAIGPEPTLELSLSNAVSVAKSDDAASMEALESRLGRGANPNVVPKGRYDAVAVAAVRQADPLLLKFLLSRGLVVSGPDAGRMCLMHAASRSLLTDKGREVFSILAENRAKDAGADCDTKTGGPLTFGITFGMATEQFNVAEAIKGLELLKATGGDLGERGPGGQSLLERLRDNSLGSQIRRETVEPLIKFLETSS